MEGESEGAPNGERAVGMGDRVERAVGLVQTGVNKGRCASPVRPSGTYTYGL